jgi:hypothetical protein
MTAPSKAATAARARRQRPIASAPFTGPICILHDAINEANKLLYRSQSPRPFNITSLR